MPASLTVVVCTKDREHTLSECLRRAAQSVATAKRIENKQILIIDDGNLSEDYIEKIEYDTAALNIPLTYVRKSPEHQKGLYGSRILAVKIVNTSHLLFIDDDCMLDATYVDEAMKMVSDNVGLAGISGVDKRNLVRPTSFQTLFWRLFLLSGGPSGGLSPTGFNYGHSHWLTKTSSFESDFVHGCNMLFPVEALRSLPNCPWLEGHSMCEDLVLAHVAGRHGKILIGPHLKFDHLETPGGRGNALKRLKRKIRSHFHFSRMRKGAGIYDLLFAWSVAGGLLHVAVKIIAARLGSVIHLKS